MRLVQGSTLLPSLDQLTADQLNQRLTYAGLILLVYELVKSMIVEPIKLFYRDTTFGETMPFKSYEQDVASRHRNEFEACLLYLRDFMEAIDSADVLTIQSLRKHRNELAHDLVNRLPTLQVDEYQALLADVDRSLFKLSNYRAYLEIGADPAFARIDWATAKGHEYALFEAVRGKLDVLNARIANALQAVGADGHTSVRARSKRAISLFACSAPDSAPRRRSTAALYRSVAAVPT
jgi:hypothetical protein